MYQWIAKTLTATVLFTASSHAMAACQTTHQVQSGDTLWKIADQNLGSVFDFVRIYDANQSIIGDDPNLIRVGTVLAIPCDDVALGDVDWSRMPRADSLAVLMQHADVQVLDIRSRDEVTDGVVPGAIWVPFDSWRGPDSNPGRPRSAEAYSKLIGDAGLDLSVPTVIVHGENSPKSTGMSAYVYWVMKSLGAEQLAILRGGYDAWEGAQYPVGLMAKNAASYEVDLAFSSTWRATEGEILDISLNGAEGLLLDARPHADYNRVDSIGSAVASTIPGALNLPVEDIMAALAPEFDIEDGAETVIEFYRQEQALGVDGDVIAFCSTGVLSALNWFYASELAGIDNVRLYPESLTGWRQNVGILGSGLF